MFEILNREGVVMVPRLAATGDRDALDQFRRWLFENETRTAMERKSELVETAPSHAWRLFVGDRMYAAYELA